MVLIPHFCNRLQLVGKDCRFSLPRLIQVDEGSASDTPNLVGYSVQEIELPAKLTDFLADALRGRLAMIEGEAYVTQIDAVYHGKVGGLHKISPTYEGYWLMFPCT